MIKSALRRGLGLSVPLFAWNLALHAQVAPTAAPAPAPAASAPATADETVQLPEFDVNSAKADPYRAETASSVNRIATSIIDAPFTVNVIPEQLIDDLSANTGYDVDRYFAGVSAGRGAGIEGISDRQDFRGFESFTRTIDNFATNGFQGNVDTAFIERQELVMGPDSILSPTGTPGGSVNVLTKSAQFTESTNLSIEAGNQNADKVILDSTGPLSSTLAYRVIYSGQQTPTYMPGSLHESDGGVMLTYRPFGKAQLTLKYMGEDWGQRGEAANANDWGEMIYTPDTLNSTISATSAEPGFGTQSWNGSATWSRRNDRINIGEAELTLPIFDVISSRFAVNYSTEHWLQDTAYPSVSPGESFNASTGIASAITLPSSFNISAMPVVGQYSASDWRGIQLQNDYAANFRLGPVSLQPVAGWTYQQSHYLYSYSAQDNNAADLPPVNLLANNGAQVVGASEHPPMSDYTHSPSNSPSVTVQKQVYGLVRTGFFDDHVYVTTGASRTFIDTINYKTTSTIPDGADLPTFVGPYTALPLDSHQDTYLGGLLIKPADYASLYYTYSSNAALTSFAPTSSSVAQPLWQTGKQQEFGFKTEFFDQRLQISGDHFQITQLNLVTPNPAFNIDTSQPPSLLADATSKGYELNVVGGITKNLSVIASVTEMKYRDAFGRRVRNVPDHLSNLLLNYHFNDEPLKGANVFLGVVHEGNVAGETITASTSLGVPEQPSFFVPGWTVLNGGAGYTWGRYRLNLNVDNIMNRVFFWDPASRISVPVYDGITARVTFTLHI